MQETGTNVCKPQHLQYPARMRVKTLAKHAKTRPGPWQPLEKHLTLSELKMSAKLYRQTLAVSKLIQSKLEMIPSSDICQAKDLDRAASM